jgi:hypothetical protein
MNIYKFSTESLDGIKSNTKLISTEKIVFDEVLEKCYDSMTMDLNQVFDKMEVTNVLFGSIDRDTNVIHLKGYVFADTPEKASQILHDWEISKNTEHEIRQEYKDKLLEQSIEFNAAFSQAKEEWKEEKRKLEQELEELLDRLERIGV